MGLHQPNRLAFGIASAPGIWLREMDQLLSGILTRSIIDDIFVTGEKDDEHPRILVMVLPQRFSHCSFSALAQCFCGQVLVTRGKFGKPLELGVQSKTK